MSKLQYVLRVEYRLSVKWSKLLIRTTAAKCISEYFMLNERSWTQRLLTACFHLCHTQSCRDRKEISDAETEGSGEGVDFQAVKLFWVIEILYILTVMFGCGYMTAYICQNTFSKRVNFIIYKLDLSNSDFLKGNHKRIVWQVVHEVRQLGRS